MSIVDVTDVAV